LSGLGVFVMASWGFVVVEERLIREVEELQGVGCFHGASLASLVESGESSGQRRPFLSNVHLLLRLQDLEE
jgi:hypothetical protein